MQKFLNTGLITNKKSIVQHENPLDSIKLKDIRIKCHEQTERLIKEIQRIELIRPNGTNLQRLISNFLSDVDSIQEVDQFGHEKALTAIIFTLSMIANHIDVQQRLFEEITMKTDTKNGGDYLNAVIKEVLRLYPPVSVIERVLGEETVIGPQFF